MVSKFTFSLWCLVWFSAAQDDQVGLNLFMQNNFIPFQWAAECCFLPKILWPFRKRTFAVKLSLPQEKVWTQTWNDAMFYRRLMWEVGFCNNVSVQQLTPEPKEPSNRLQCQGYMLSAVFNMKQIKGFFVTSVVREYFLKCNQIEQFSSFGSWLFNKSVSY